VGGDENVELPDRCIAFGEDAADAPELQRRCLVERCHLDRRGECVDERVQSTRPLTVCAVGLKPTFVSPGAVSQQKISKSGLIVGDSPASRGERAIV
jgi:hypothetical protein